MIEHTITLSNKLGLHARAAAKLVQTAGNYPCEVEIRKGTQTVSGKSIMGVMMLAASCGTAIQLIVNGEQEQEALQALIALIEGRFGEDE